MNIDLLNKIVLALPDDVILDVRNLGIVIDSNYEDDGTEQPPHHEI